MDAAPADQPDHLGLALRRALHRHRKGGKLFIFGDEWIEFDSEWKNIPQIKKFWVNILGWLSPMNFCTIPQ